MDAAPACDYEFDDSIFSDNDSDIEMEEKPTAKFALGPAYAQDFSSKHKQSNKTLQTVASNNISDKPTSYTAPHIQEIIKKAMEVQKKLEEQGFTNFYAKQTKFYSEQKPLTASEILNSGKNVMGFNPSQDLPPFYKYLCLQPDAPIDANAKVCNILAAVYPSANQVTTDQPEE